MSPSQTLSSIEENKLKDYNNSDWSNLEDDEQLEYALLFHKKNGKIDDKSVHAIKARIKEHRNSQQIVSNLEFDKLAYAYLNGTSNYHPLDYMYLSWLCTHYGWHSKINRPKEVVETTMHYHDFVARFGFNELRAKLLSHLTDFIKELKENGKISIIQIIVGGSFVTNKESPSDIDFAVITTNLSNNIPDLNDVLYRINHSISTLLDFRFIDSVSKSGIESFYEYNILHRLANNVTYKEKINENITNNNFKSIIIIKINM